MTEIFELDLLELARKSNPDTHLLPGGNLPFGHPPTELCYSTALIGNWPLHLVDHFECHAVMRGSRQRIHGPLFDGRVVIPGPVEVNLNPPTYCTCDGRVWNGIEYGLPGSNALDEKAGLLMFLRCEDYYEVVVRGLAKQQKVHSTNIAKEAQKTEEATDLLKVLGEFDEETWKNISDGWINCEPGESEPDFPAWCVDELYGTYTVRYENGWYVQEGEAETLQDLRRLMNGMIAADKALEKELSSTET